MKYFAIQVKTRGEEKYLKLAESSLSKNNSDAGLSVKLLWPRRRLTIYKKGVKKDTLAPIFPGYIFLETEELKNETYRNLKKTSGFFRFLRNNQNIEPLSGKDEMLLLHFLSFGEVVDKSTVYFDENNKIKVLHGPLKGLEGKIIKVDKRKRRAKIKLSLYKNSFLIDFSFDTIEQVNVKDE